MKYAVVKSFSTSKAPKRFTLNLIGAFMLAYGLFSFPVTGKGQGMPVDFWVNIGVGIDYVIDSEYPGIGPAIRAGAAMQMRRFNISTHITGNSSGKSPYAGPSVRYLRNQYFESGLLFGINTSPTGKYWVIPSLGLGAVFGNRVIPDSTKIEYGLFEPIKPLVGLPIEVAILGNTKMAGFGFYLHGNINRRASLFGIAMVFAFGNIQRPPE